MLTSEELGLLAYQQERHDEVSANQIFYYVSLHSEATIAEFLFDKQLREMNSDRALWFLIKNLLVRFPEKNAWFSAIGIYAPQTVQSIHYLLGILLKNKQLGLRVSEYHVAYIIDWAEHGTVNLHTDELDLAARNFAMLKSLTGRDVVAGNDDLRLYIRIVYGYYRSDEQIQGLVKEIDNSRFLNLGQIAKLSFSGAKFAYSFYFAPKYALLKNDASQAVLATMLHQYCIRRDTSDVAHYFETISAKYQTSKAVCYQIVEAIVERHTLSFYQITFFMTHVLCHFSKEILDATCAAFDYDLLLIQYIGAKFCDRAATAFPSPTLLSQTDVQLLFYLIVATKRYDLLSPALLDRLIISEEMTTNRTQLRRLGFKLSKSCLAEMRPESVFHYIELIDEQDLLLSIAKTILVADCYDFEGVFDYLLCKMQKAYYYPLFYYYVDNFKVEADLRHRWICVSRFIKMLARKDELESYVFLGVECPGAVRAVIANAFADKDPTAVLRAAFLLQQLDDPFDEMLGYARYCMFVTQNVTSRIEDQDENEEETSDEDYSYKYRLKAMPDYTFTEIDSNDINSFVPCQISPASNYYPCTDYYAISCCLHFLKAIAYFGKLSDVQASVFYAYLLTVRIVSTVKFFLKLLPPPPEFLKKLMIRCIKETGFHTARNSVTLRLICSKHFTKQELFLLYDLSSLQSVHINLEAIPLEDIIANIDGEYLRTTTFSAAMGLCAATKEKTYSCSGTCDFIGVSCKNTGTVCKLIALKHIRVIGRQREKAIDFLRYTIARQTSSWSDEQFTILASYGLVNYCNVDEYSQIRQSLSGKAGYYFEKAILAMWGLSLQELASHFACSEDRV